MSTINFGIDQPGQLYQPYWKKCITAGRAAEGLREDWRSQLREVQRQIGFEYIRFHGIFHEDMMIYREENGAPIYNWQYLDSLVDFLLSVNIRPLLELSFMPYDLASGEAYVFWWKGNITPPKDEQRWVDLVNATVCHCIERYGIEEILRWYFEVWNEPNLQNGFWSGNQAAYFRLYSHTAQAIKAIHPGLRVGGPASSDSGGVKAPWVDEFLAYCTEQNLPVDFLSTHPYPNTWALDGYNETIMGYRGPESTVVDMRRIRKSISESAFPNAEIHLTEWNSSPSPRDLVHDTAFMAPFVVQNNINGIGLVDSLAFWTFTDVFEEGRAGDTLFHGGFGLMNAQGLKKPSYYGYWFLSKLGREKLLSGEDFFVSRKGDKVQILMWNYCHYTEAFAAGDRSTLTPQERYQIFTGQIPRSFNLTIAGLNDGYKVTETSFDRQHGSAFDTWQELGAPANPVSEELEWLRHRIMPEMTIYFLDKPGLYNRQVTLQPHGVTLIELQKLYSI
jgi:beta-xylosidase